MEESKINVEYAEAVIKAMYLVGDYTPNNVKQAMELYQKVTKEFSVEKIKALGQLYNQQNPITYAEIISSNHRIVHLTFLERVDYTTDLEELSDLELKKLVFEKLLDEKFRKDAEKEFFIQL